MNDLKEQISLLEIHNQNYDNGQTLLYKSIATSLRVLLHDTDRSCSLFFQNKLKNRLFFSTLNDDSFPKPVMTSDGSSLVSIQVKAINGAVSAQFFIPFDKKTASLSEIHPTNINELADYKPLLDEPIYAGKMISFPEWWNEKVLIVEGKPSKTRKDIILNIANKDGGAHNDEKIPESYQKAKSGESLGISVGGKTVPGIQKAITRQISFEFIKSWHYILADPYPSLGRKDNCGCGSLKKYKRCCLKDRWNQDSENLRFKKWSSNHSNHIKN